MSWSVGELRTALQEVVAGFEPERLEPADAARLVKEFATIENIAAAGKALAARRADQSGAWRRDGDRSPAQWLAREIGVSVGQAIATLETAKRLADLPATEEEARKGVLSAAQTKEIASGASADPAAEGRLLETARRGGMRRLREESMRVRAAARGADEQAQHERIRQGRYLRTWTDHEGAFCASLRTTADKGGKLLAALEPRRELIFTEPRRQGRRELYEAYMADALDLLVDDAERGSQRPGESRGAPRAMMHVRIDHPALVRGHVEAGETCEIPGVGPVPVAVARELLDDCILKVLVTDGVDVQAVAHAGRNIPAHLRTALEHRDLGCEVPECDIDHHLEIDHIIPVVEGGPTALWNLAWLCRWHHYLKTHCDYRLEGPPGERRWVHPDKDPPDP